MKNRIAPLAAAALLSLCSCANNKPTETTAASTKAAETTAVSTAEAETTAASTAEAETAPGTEKTLLTDFYGIQFYKEDAQFNADLNSYTFDYAPTLFSAGYYNDSEMNPSDFDTENYEYSGQSAARELSNDIVTTVRSGDVIQGHTVESADTTIVTYDFDGEEFVSFLADEIKFSGDIELTGMLRFYYDEMYTVMSGDIRFTPDSSYAGLPCGVGGMDTAAYCRPDFFVIENMETGEQKEGGGAAFYSDTQMFELGNLFNDYADRSDLFALLGGGKDNASVKVKVVLSDVCVSWSEQFGNTHSSARIKSIELA